MLTVRHSSRGIKACEQLAMLCPVLFDCGETFLKISVCMVTFYFSQVAPIQCMNIQRTFQRKKMESNYLATSSFLMFLSTPESLSTGKQYLGHQDNLTGTVK